MDMGRIGLREMKKQMTRKTIADAALKLTEERGLDEVTIDDIAREAFVSPRTISNYFATKEEAVLGAFNLGVEQVIDDFATRSPEGPPLQRLCTLMRDYARENPAQLRQAAQVTALEAENPSLRRFRIERELELIELLAHRLAACTGTDPKTDLYPGLVALAAISAVNMSLAMWARRELPDEQLPELIQDAFNIVSDGYPHPAKNAPEQTAPEPV
ncbi:TetR/AcrR family transcriptional regulator [Nesterenkonia sp. NBAIMH1]|uniref:TetR/AcrR family transcriptional regulator n=1 Tax=Nesterenkonia sp. NBAIMH1 TaxID=2600320 RepID=UPI0011B7811C|nr:TetR/AcrR family transcriptional regulator [Nesterenkonia sp. NBAIMH1]